MKANKFEYITKFALINKAIRETNKEKTFNHMQAFNIACEMSNTNYEELILFVVPQSTKEGIASLVKTDTFKEHIKNVTVNYDKLDEFPFVLIVTCEELNAVVKDKKNKIPYKEYIIAIRNQDIEAITNKEIDYITQLNKMINGKESNFIPLGHH